MMIFFILLLFCHGRKNMKMVLRFNTPILQDLKNSSFSHSRLLLSENDLDQIFLNEKALCVLLSNLDLLEKSDKLKNVVIEKVAIFKDNKDVWNKLRFTNETDSTGYFKGIHTDKFNLEETMLFHSENLDEEIKKKNVFNIKKLLFYIGIIKGKPINKILKEDCKLDMIDLVIFKNLYHFEKNDEIKVCVCRDVECTVCEGIYETKRSAL